MIIKYSIGSKEFNTDTTNDDLIVTKNNNDNRYTITIKALKDMLLDKASLDIKFNANFKDLYFFNGYQSWTDSFESKLARRERNIYKSPHLIAKSYAMDKYGDATFYKYSIKYTLFLYDTSKKYAKTL